jgi:hypothetical protein
MGAGPEPVAALAKVIIPAAASKLTKDPFCCSCLGFVRCAKSCQFRDSRCRYFLHGDIPRSNFSFKDTSFSYFISKPQTKNIHDKYIDTLDTPLDTDNSIIVGLRNQNYGAGVDIKMKVWAVVVKPL